jgi:beta-phosphoglucomutase-like phosphatase (HAD superfamily)
MDTGSRAKQDARAESRIQSCPWSDDGARDIFTTGTALASGSKEVTNKLLSSAEVTGCIEQVISVDHVRLWKPRKEIYLHCAPRCGVESAAMTLIASHGWDIHGAKNAGLATAFLRRLGKLFAEVIKKCTTSQQ